MDPHRSCYYLYGVSREQAERWAQVGREHRTCGTRIRITGVVHPVEPARELSPGMRVEDVRDWRVTVTYEIISLDY